MKINPLYVVGGIGAAVLAYVVITRGKAALNAVNPMNNDNIINQGFTSLYQQLTGSEDTLGADIYDITHDGTLNPASDQNLAYRSANAWGTYFTGDKNFTLGGWLYDVTH